jgi:hypothetical protein
MGRTQAGFTNPGFLNWNCLRTMQNHVTKMIRNKNDVFVHTFLSPDDQILAGSERFLLLPEKDWSPNGTTEISQG